MMSTELCYVYLVYGKLIPVGGAVIIGRSPLLAPRRGETRKSGRMTDFISSQASQTLAKRKAKLKQANLFPPLADAAKGPSESKLAKIEWHSGLSTRLTSLRALDI